MRTLVDLAPSLPASEGLTSLSTSLKRSTESSSVKCRRDLSADVGARLSALDIQGSSNCAPLSLQLRLQEFSWELNQRASGSGPSSDQPVIVLGLFDRTEIHQDPLHSDA